MYTTPAGSSLHFNITKNFTHAPSPENTLVVGFPSSVFIPYIDFGIGLFGFTETYLSPNRMHVSLMLKQDTNFGAVASGNIFNLLTEPFATRWKSVVASDVGTARVTSTVNFSGYRASLAVLPGARLVYSCTTAPDSSAVMREAVVNFIVNM